MFMTILSSSVLILLLLCLRPFMKKRFSPVIQYSLWALVALRLLNPFQLWQSPLSLENLTVRESSPIVDVQNSPVQSLDSIPIDQPHETPSNMETTPLTPIGTTSQTSRPVSDTDTPLQAATQHKQSLTTEEILNSIWLAGCAAMALWFLGVNLSFARKAKLGARQVQIPVATLPVYESEHIPSPCLLGLIKPRIYILPCEDSIAQKHILAHEETHYRHWDHVWSLIRSLCLCIFWFNPLVWVAAHLSKEDCEAACDHGAIVALGEEERIPYGKTLLHTLAQVNRPGNLLRSATTMAGGKAQIRNRLERIVSKPKKALWAVLMLVLVLCISVGCTFTSASETDLPEQGAESQTATEDQAKLPSEELPVVDADPDPSIEPEETTPGKEKTNGIQVEDYLKDENIHIPQFTPEKNYCETANREILELFKDNPNYRTVDYSVTRTPWFDALWGEEIEVLSLLITAETMDGETLFAAYNVNAQTGYSADLPYISTKRKTEVFARELLNRYRDTGSLSYTESTHALLLRNLNHTQAPGDLSQNTVHWITEEGELAASFIYYPLDGGAPYRYTTIDHNTPTEDISINAFVDPHVVELYTFVAGDSNGEVNHIPFLIMDSPRGVEINGEILRLYSRIVQGTTFSWSLHGEILSLAITAEELYTAGEVNSVYTLSTKTYSDASGAEVLAMAGMTEEEYASIAGPMFEDQFFHLFPVKDAGLTVPHSILSKSGTPENVADSIPYLAEDGSLWALARIYQIAGSSSGWYPVPITNHQFTEEYLTYTQP